MRRLTFASGLSLALAIFVTGCNDEGGGTDDLGPGENPDMPATVESDFSLSTFSDFPAAPQVDPGLAAGFPDQFTAASDGGGAGGGPCLTEPSFGAMIPTNWTPLFVDWKPVGSQNVYELRVHVDNQVNDLVVYTTQKSYTMTASMWALLAQHSNDRDVTITVRGAVLSGSTIIGGVETGSSGSVHIAPVAAPGNIVYWTTSNNSALKGFPIGASTVATIVTPPLMNDGTTCVGCHTSSPDGTLSFLSRKGAMGSFSVDARLVDGTAAKASGMQVSANAITNLARQNQTLPTLSGAHYSDTDAVVITTLNNNTDTAMKTELVWTDLHAATGGTGILARTGDAKQAATPNWSHDGTNVVYTSSDGVGDGRTNSAETDLYIVPYNNHAGGAATPVAGASAPGVHEFYPVFSADDALLAYDQSPMSANTYNEPKAEVYVIPSTGGTGKRLSANDPPVCSGVTSPGVTNSWPRWAPEVQVAGNRRFHWVVFSSTRRGRTSTAHPDPLPQLYVSAIVVDAMTGAITDYPAVYVHSQPGDEANHTPAWDIFKLPPIL